MHAQAEKRGISWREPRMVAVLVALAVAVTMLAPTAAVADEDVSVIVRMEQGAIADPGALVARSGGVVTAELDIIDGVAAELPLSALEALAAQPGVASVTLDGEVQLTGWNYAGEGQESVATVVDRVINADQFWNAGFTGTGVDIAMIDSGVSPVDGLTTPGKVVNGPDLSFESQDPDLMYLDSYGHGTHLAGIMAGRADAAPDKLTTKEIKRHFLGVAPDARIVSVKVATRNGATDVSQVIAAIDWVVQHRNENGLDIRVLNLSFGTDGAQSYVLDPLSFAVEQAWRNGIVVVTAAGNDGKNTPLRNPATNPFVIAVGAADTRDDHSVASFSSCGDDSRHVDVVASGRSVVSLLAPGSDAAESHPDAIVDGEYIVGSGTSQAAAVVSGAAALIIDQRPGITPDQVKALLMSTADRMPSGSSLCQGAGLIDLKAALNASTPKGTQKFTPSTGAGLLEGSRGSHHISHGDAVLEGEQDIFGNAWDGDTWSDLSAAGISWSGGDWNGATWTGISWSGISWSGLSWSGISWSGLSWSGLSWSGLSWSGLSWSGLSWSALGWL